MSDVKKEKALQALQKKLLERRKRLNAVVEKSFLADGTLDYERIAEEATDFNNLQDLLGEEKEKNATD